MTSEFQPYIDTALDRLSRQMEMRILTGHDYPAHIFGMTHPDAPATDNKHPSQELSTHKVSKPPSTRLPSVLHTTC